MNLLEAMVRTRGAEALGWTLVHSLWEGALAALVLAAVLTLARSSRGRYAAACAALTALVAALVVTFISMMPEARAATVARGLLPAALPGGVGGGAFPGPWSAAQYLPWLAPFWVVGVLAFQARSVAGWMAAQRMRTTGVTAAPAVWQEQVDRLSARVRLSRPVALLESCLAEAPVVFGFLKPVILAPAGLLAGLPPSQVEAILLHELAHIRRHDYLVNLVQVFVESLLFYHPAVWWMGRVIRQEREHCCDDVAVAVQGSAYEYAAALTALEQTRALPREAMASTGGSLVRRVRRLLRPAERPAGIAAPVIAAGVLMVAVAAAAWAWQAAPQPKSPYERWVIEDVAYIINDRERAAFEQLRTDPEREKFIEQFWERRDPTPGTPANELKEEHYRRIASANELFAASVPGWKTDRGRIYIQYGPPDGVSSQPDGPLKRALSENTALMFSFIQWRYPGVERDTVFIFFDVSGTGDYRLARRLEIQ